MDRQIIVSDHANVNRDLPTQKSKRDARRRGRRKHARLLSAYAKNTHAAVITHCRSRCTRLKRTGNELKIKTIVTSRAAIRGSLLSRPVVSLCEKLFPFASRAKLQARIRIRSAGFHIGPALPETYHFSVIGSRPFSPSPPPPAVKVALRKNNVLLLIPARGTSLLVKRK